MYTIEYIYLSILSVTICFLYHRSKNKNVMCFLAEIYILLALVMTYVIRHFVDNEFGVWMMCFALITIIVAILGFRIKLFKEFKE